MRTEHARWFAVLATAAIMAAGCGSSSGGDNGQTVEPSADAGEGDAAGTGDAAGVDATGNDTADEALMDAVDPIEPQDDGMPCLADDECQSGTCLSDQNGFPGGFCTVTDCESRRDCNGVDRACLRGEFNGNLCVELCQVDGDCREGYECVGDATGAYCFPGFANAALEPRCESEFIAAADIRGGGGFGGFGGGETLDRRRIRFTIDDDTTSFAVVAWDDNHTVQPDSIELPDGTASSLGDYANYLYTPLNLQRVSPLLFPGGPQFIEMVMPGEYTMDFGYGGSEDDSLCFVVLEDDEVLTESSDTLSIDMNFYFVGVPGLSSRTADEDADFQEMLESFDDTMSIAGVELGDVRYYDVTGDVEDRFEVIRTQDGAFDLVELTRQPGSDRESLLSANVFFIRGFGGRDMGSVLGISTGIPGVPGIHGQPGTGLVFSSEYLGGRGGSDLVGQVLAHELGHFLGLFHTTEQFGGQSDHLDDTPICTTISDQNLPACPDFSNLMFPIASPRENLEISPGQTIIVRANPLTYYPE